MNTTRYALFTCALFGVAALGAPALAQTIPDDPYADEEKEDLPQELSNRLEPTPGTLHTLAECEARQGRIATAIARFKQFIDVASAAPPSKRSRYEDRGKY